MKTNSLKEALKKLILLDADDSGELLETVRLHLSAMKPSKTLCLNRSPVKSVKKIRRADDEYVYDIGMQNENRPWYFGNNILIHNSVYFSAYPLFQDKIASGELTWTSERVIEIYDTVSEQVNETFPAFMTEAFNCPRTQGEVIRAGRELVAIKGIYMTKKRYAVLIIDKEGKRKDQHGHPGEIKAMGLEMKRSDTPEFMQRFLEEVLLMTLEGQDQRKVMERVKQFRDEFKSRPGWEKGTPKRVNNLTKHTDVYRRTGKCGVGHAMAAINWNRLREAFSDRRSMEITDGQKTIVCKLKPNPLQVNSIAYPIDEMHLPEWFKQLPFDHAAMEETIIDSKIENLLGVLDWNLNLSKDQGFVNDLFD